MNQFDLNTIPWYQWLILAAIPPLIFLLYFLKLRRAQLQVPSTYLWTRTIEDMHVNSLWQRLRKNLLLFLQLLIALLLALSCLRPGCRSERLTGDRFIFVVDQSASMSATDLPSGKTRLDDAKQRVRETIDRMQGSDVAMLISFSDRAIVHQSYTTNKTLLKRKLDRIKQTERGSDITEALTAASGLANPGRTSDRESNIDMQVAEGRDAVLQIFSDGGVKEVPRFSLGKLTAEYFPIGSFEQVPNVGVTAFSINDQLENSTQIEVFSRLQNSGLADTKVDLSLFVDNELFDARSGVPLKGLSATSVNFDLSGLVGNIDAAVPIRLEIDTQDAYLQDNTAYCVLNPPRLASVLIVSENEKYLRLAVETDRASKLATVQFAPAAYLTDQEYQQRSTLGFYDLIIFDQCVPKSMPRCNTVFWGALPPDADSDQPAWLAEQTVEVTPIVDVDSTHPLMQSVQMTTVNVLGSKILKGPTGSLSLVDSVAGSIMQIGPRGGFQDLVIGFPLISYDDSGDATTNTDWPRKLSFPIFIQNMLATLSGSSRFSKSADQRPGELINFRARLPYDQVTVTPPGGKPQRLSARPDNAFVFADTQSSGIYEVRGGDAEEIDQLIPVNLLDRRESDLAVREKMELGYVEIEGTRTKIPARREYWPWLVAATLAIVLIEWWIYNRRVLI